MCWIHDFALTDQLQFGNKVLTSWRLLKITPLAMNWQLTVATKLVKWKWFESVFRVSQESQRIPKEPQRIPTKLKTVAMERKSQRKDRSGSHGNLSENLQTNRKSFRNPMRILKRNSVNLPRILENLKRIANWVWTRKNEGQILLNRILLCNCHNKSFFFPTVELCCRPAVEFYKCFGASTQVERKLSTVPFFSFLCSLHIPKC